MRPRHATQAFAALTLAAVGAAACGPVSAPPDARDDAASNRPDAPAVARDGFTADTSAPPTPGPDASTDPPDAVAPPPRDGAVSPGDGGGVGVGISAGYPQDRGIAGDRRVIFHSDFERGFEGWSDRTRDPSLIDVLATAGLAHAGTRYLRTSVTRTQLAADQYISAQTQYRFPARVPQIYWRFYTRFVGMSATPHHWVRVGAGNATYQLDGLANTRPAGDQGFWFDLDARDDGRFNFYAYWHQMRSGRCNDGTAVPGCAGDQGTTYYYGNNFNPAGQTPFPRDTWFCIELMSRANTVGASDGELALWINDRLVGEYRPGTPRGRWLRDNFYTWGPYYRDEQAFEGFNWRTSTEVGFKRIVIDAYYERGSLQARIDGGLTVPEAQVILYDDVVVATERVGCMAP